MTNFATCGRLACTRSLERRTAVCVLFVTCYLLYSSSRAVQAPCDTPCAAAPFAAHRLLAVYAVSSGRLAAGQELHRLGPEPTAATSFATHEPRWSASRPRMSLPAAAGRHAGADHAPASATAGFADGACANWLCPWHALAAVLQLACQDGTAARHATRTMRRLSGPLYGRAFARVLVSVGLKGLR